MTFNLLIETIKATPIETLIGQFIDLQPDGDRLIGPCPFPHGGTPDAPEFETTSSLTVYPRKQDFYCFGCNKGNSQLPDHWGRKQYGSDVIAFWRELRRQQTGQEEPFQDAVISLARQLGLDHLIPEQQENRETAEILRVLGQRANRWYTALQQAPHVIRHLINRGVSEAIIERYQLGLAADANGDYRNRITIPVHHAYSGRTIAFSYYAFEPDPKAKYLHSPNSAVWRASDHLFGLHEAASAIAKQGYVILTEGFFDTLVMASVGITNIVAMMGVSIRENQARTLRRHTDTLYWWIEDDAGLAGLNAAAPMLLTMGFRLFVIAGNADADDFCLRLDLQPTKIKAELPGLSAYAVQWLVVKQYKDYQNGNISEDRALLILSRLLQACHNPSDRALMGREIRQRFDVDPILLLEVS